MVATLAETTSILSLPHLRRKMLVDPVGRRILREKPIISSSTLTSSYLSSLPPNSFGYNYYHNFLLKYDVTPDSRSPVHFIDNEEEAYIMLRYRQIHDFWHTLTGVPVSVEGEVGLKVFELVQTGLPMTLLSSILGPLKLNSTEKKRFWNNYVPWAVKCGSSSMFLLNVYYEEILDKDLNQIRKELGIWVPPFLSEVGRDHDVILAGANQSAHEKDSLKVE
ncbi:ubiquinone biosynthesis protein Coq4 [Paraphysoderma sedebokerense]|nr:ubiquinone biosynthesis protein Coq4 [Paraphysoderma sedebokerense]